GGLTAQRGSPFFHQSRDVAVTDRRSREGDALAFECRFQPIVGHDSADHAGGRESTLALPISRDDPEDVIAVYDAAPLVGEDGAIRGAVVSDAKCCAALSRRGGHARRMERAAALVDVAAVRIGVNRRDARPGSRESSRPELERSAVARIDDNVQSLQWRGRALREALEV